MRREGERGVSSNTIRGEGQPSDPSQANVTSVTNAKHSEKASALTNRANTKTHSQVSAPALYPSLDKQVTSHERTNKGLERQSPDEVPLGEEGVRSSEEKPAEDDVPSISAEVLQAKLEQIDSVRSKIDEFRPRIEGFSGQKGSKDYVYCEETLMSHLLKLDQVKTLGQPTIRTSRKALVREIQNLLALLESRAT